MPALAIEKPEFTGPSAQMRADEQDLRNVVPNLEEKLAPIRERQAGIAGEMEKLAAKGPPPVPDLQPVPQFQPREISTDEMWNFASIATAFGALGSIAARNGVRGALNSAASAMQGFHNGNIAQAKLDIDNFKAKSQAAIAANAQTLEKYRTILESEKYTWEQKMNLWKVAAQEAGDQVTLANLQGNNLRHALKYGSDMVKMQNQYESRYLQTVASFEARLAGQQALIQAALIRSGQNLGPAGGQPGLGGQPQNPALGWYTPEGLDLAGWQFLLTGRYPPLGVGAGAGRVKAGIESHAQQIGKAMGMSPQEMALLPRSVGAQTKALDFMTKWQAGVMNATGIVDRNFDVMTDYAKRVGLTEIQPLNQMKLLIQRNLGDADAQAYEVAAQTVMREYARVLSGPMSNAQLHVHAMTSAENTLNSRLTLDQLGEIRNVMKRDMTNIGNQTTDTINGIRENMMLLNRPHAGGGGGGGGGGGVPVQKSTSKSGKPIVSRDGGKTWTYE